MASLGINLGGDPGLQTNSGSSDFNDFLKLATLGTQTFLGYTALNSPRPATVQFLPNGQPLVTGGGATPVGSGAIGSIPGIVWIMLAVLLIVLLIRR